MKYNLVFTPVDTLFFRESRPMETPGSSELGSIFPPPMRTVAGAIRTLIGENMGVDWKQFRKGKQPKVEEVIGLGNDYKKLCFQGPWLSYKDKTLFPAPLNLIAKRQDEAERIDERKKILSISSMFIGESCKCDLGENVSLACVPEDMVGCKNLANHWLTAEGLQKILTCKEDTIEPEKEIFSKSDLLLEENRLGIAIDSKSKIVKDSMLYQTRHIRLKEAVSFFVQLSGYEKNIEPDMIKLGGEGRLVSVTQESSNNYFPAPPSPDKNKSHLRGIIIYLLTPMLLDNNSEFLPGFSKQEEVKQTFWQGEINGVSLRLISSVIGKVQREGGWDMAKHKPQTLKSLIPAGSVFYCEVEDGDIKNAIDKLHNKQIGTEKHLGRGHIAIGLWQKNNKQEDNHHES